MPCYYIGEYGYLNEHEFSDLPKGNMLELAMNPYNGKVYLKLCKQADSAEVALSIMRDLVSCCDMAELAGIDEPLKNMLETMGGELLRVSDAARVVIRLYEGGSRQHENEAAEGARQVKRVS